MRLFSMALASLCVAVSPAVWAVNPPPDGCYPNLTTAEGCDALVALWSPAQEIRRWLAFALFRYRPAASILVWAPERWLLNNADANTALGAVALLLNTTGTQNTAVGADALVNNDTGSSNTANGSFALFSNIEGNRNTAIGFHALENNTANSNTAVGADTLGANATGF